MVLVLYAKSYRPRRIIAVTESRFTGAEVKRFFTAVHIKDTRFECFAGLGSKSVVGTWTEVDYSFSLFLQGYLKYLVERPIGWEPNL